MKRVTILISLLFSISLIAVLGAFLSLSAGDIPGGDPLEPPENPPLCNNHSYYDCYVDIQSDTGAVDQTKGTDDTEILVPVRMYATDNVTYDGLTIEAFKNTIYFDPDYLEFDGIESGEWDAENITAGSGECGHCIDDLDSIKIEGDGDVYTFPEEDWAVMYYIKFKVLCVENLETVMDLDITSTNEGENWLDLYTGGVEGFDAWIEDPGDPDENEDGYVYLDDDYFVGLHIDTTTVYLGSTTEVTVYCDSINYRCGWFVHYLEYDSDLFTLANPQKLGLLSDWTGALYVFPSGDDITILCSVGSGTIIDDVTSTTPMYSITFVPISGETTDNVQSPVIWDPEEEHCVKPGGCYEVNSFVDYGLGDGLVEIPKYEVDVTLDFIGEDKKLGDYDTLVVYIENSFPLGLRAENPGSETGGDLRVLIEHAEQLEFTGTVSGNGRLNLDIHDPNDEHVKIYLNPPSGGKEGWLLPTTSPVELCRLEFLIPTDADYDDWPPELGAAVVDEWGSYFTIASDTTGVDTMDLNTYGDFTQTGDEIDVAIVAEVYAEDVSGQHNVDQPIRINTTVDVDSLFIHLEFDWGDMCVRDMVPSVPGIVMTKSYGNVYLRGSSLGILAADEILLGTVTFGSRDVPSTQHTNTFNAATHIIDGGDNLHYVVRTSGDISITTDQLHKCPDINHWKQEGVILPENYVLHQNYPNPFNPFTTIKFELPEFQWVKLDIFNVLGQHVTTLINSAMDPGVHEVTWNAGSNISSGVYFYSLQAGTFAETKKMLLLK